MLVLLFVRNILVSKFGAWGYPLTARVVYFFARKGLKKAVPAVRAWLREKKEVYMAWKITRPQQIGVLGVALLLLVPPFPSKVSTDFILEPGRDAHVRAKVAGVVGRVFVHEGDQVKAGQVLMELENPEITADAEILSQSTRVGQWRGSHRARASAGEGCLGGGSRNEAPGSGTRGRAEER